MPKLELKLLFDLSRNCIGNQFTDKFFDRAKKKPDFPLVKDFTFTVGFLDGDVGITLVFRGL